MGIHVAGVAVQGQFAEDPVPFLNALGLTVAQEVSLQPGHFFFSPMEKSIVRVCLTEDWSLVSGDLLPPLDMILRLEHVESRNHGGFDFLHDRLAAASAEGSALCFILESTSGTYGFDWFEAGDLRRSIWEIEGEVVANEGAALFDDERDYIAQLKEDETALLPLLERLTVNFDRLADCRSRGFLRAWGVTAKKKPFWRFW